MLDAGDLLLMPCDEDGTTLANACNNSSWDAGKVENHKQDILIHPAKT
jgi:hypothetical protein